MTSKSIWKLTALVAIVMTAGFVIAATAFTPSAQPIGYVAQLEITNYKLTSGNEIVFKSDYQRENWNGNVYAYPVSTAGEINTAAEWWSGGAAPHLDAQDYNTGRIIVTMKDDGTKIPFRWANLSSAQQTSIGNATILDYVRGQRTNELASGGTFRTRTSTLGDIVHSRPYYLANSGSPVLFVGANDGMLHAFNAKPTGGNELWAYVPSMLLSSLPALKVDPYVHTYFVDGGLNVGKVVISGASKTVLVSSLGAGGRGLFALDVTNPIPTSETEAAANILWEITNTKINNATSTSFANLGHTYGTPVITKVNSGSGQSAVILGNGYNASGASSLFVVDVANGSLIREISTSGAGNGGLSTPLCIDSTGDGQVDYCYAGDIDGKLWKFDLTNSNASSWSASLLYTTSPAQAITMAPTVVAHPYGGYMVNFATGRMFTDADKTDTAVHYAYGIWDGAPVANTSMLTQTLAERSYVNGLITTRVRVATTANQPDWTAGVGHHKGWQVALPVGGERVIGDTVYTENGRFYFNSTNPTITNVSPTPNGENWLMELDAMTGSTINSPFLDLNGDHLLTDADRVKYVTGDTIPSGKTTADLNAGASGIPVGKFISNGVGSHPILVQLATLNTTLVNQNPDVIIPAATADRGVSGGHFDVDIFYGPPPSKICNYSTSGGSSGAKATGKVVFDYGSSAKNVTGTLTIKVGTETIKSGVPGSKKDTELASWVGTAGSANYDVSISTSGNKGTVTITAKAKGSAWNGTVTLPTPAGLSNSDITITHVTGGSNVVAGTDTFVDCPTNKHFHEYDDIFNVTGVNMLNASSTTLNLSNGITSTATGFKVLVHNQYLSPAATLSIGGAAHTSVKTYNNLASETVAANVIANAPTYTRANVQTLEWNMPVDAFTPKDWWGNGDVRVGLQPTKYSCVWDSTPSKGETLFQPVMPPVNGVDGPGVNGTTTGARHNGALVIQIIKDTTPASALELNVAGRPEYGWRVKAADFETYVLTEYATYWHHPNGICYGVSGWSKSPPLDLTPSDPSVYRVPAAGSADPALGSFRSTSNVVSVITTTVGLVTTTVTTYANSTRQTVTKTKNNDGTVTIVTVNPDGSTTTVTFADSKGDMVSGGDERGSQAKTGRLSWSELLNN
jgi:type IV pilus assembly protein PilY1